MPICTLEFSAFEDFIGKNEIVLLDFWADWCAPCKQFAITYEKVSEKYPDIPFAKVNVEKETDFADNFGVQSIPHVMVFKKGILIYSESGAMPESVLLELVEQALEVDVDEILKKLNEEE